MLASLLIGVVAGARSMTPLAAVADARAKGRLAAGNGAPAFLGHPAVAAGAKAMAAGELFGDKLHAAPDRTVPAGMAARVLTGALAGAALAPRRQALAGGLLGATAAVASAYLTLALRNRAMARFGQKPTGLVEDALALGATHLILRSARPDPGTPRPPRRLTRDPIETRSLP